MICFDYRNTTVFGFAEDSDDHSKVKNPHDVSAKEDCNNALSPPVQNR